MIPGERFEIDLDRVEQSVKQEASSSPFSFVGDVLERKPAAPAPPSAPTPRNKTGFPEHRKRPIESRFKRQQKTAGPPKATVRTEDDSGKAPNSVSAPRLDPEEPSSFEDQQRSQIDQQNRDVLAGMSEADIEQERQELMGSLDPELLQMLLKRSNIDSGSNETTDLRPPPPPVEGGILQREKPAKSKTVSFEDGPTPLAPIGKDKDWAEVVELDYEPDFPRIESEGEEDGHTDELGKVLNHDHDPGEHDSLHFPIASQPPSLDPNSATFLTDLHEKYFPSLPADPDKLEWMREPKDDKSAYSSSASGLNPNEIRFAFTGQLLPPKASSEIPVTEGLHHHGLAPDSAGYTIPELAHLMRSTYPAQRCIAFQTLGRILYRLGTGEFGDPGEPGMNTVGAEDTFGELARGLWREMEKEKIVQGLTAESEGNGIDGGRHLSAKAYATEALWLWHKGGGQRWKAD